VNLAHVHLILNHVPTVGFGVGFGLLLIAFAGKHHDDLKQLSLVVLFFVAVLTIPVFLSGNAAEFVLRGGKDGPPRFPVTVSVPAIRTHEDAALLAFVFMEFTGFFAWLALWQWRRTARFAHWNIFIVVVLSLLTFGLMTRAATLGGQIRHQELRTGAQETGGPVEWPGEGTARSIGMWVTGVRWVWPTCETLHFIGLCLLFTAVLFVDLRTLGIAKSIPMATAYQLLPIGMLGFGINLITGMLFFLGTPQQYVENKTYVWKFVCLVIAAANDLYFMLSNRTWNVGFGDDAPSIAKLAAVVGMAAWVGVLFCGHMLPFIGNAF
jgi:hypothetical protein